MARDLLVALRALSKNPWFLLAVIAILALGIGANTAVFSIADAVLLRPASVSSFLAPGPYRREDSEMGDERRCSG
jgi:ABC-type transport system involved in cytochrome c biogenesis permease component